MKFKKLCFLFPLIFSILISLCCNFVSFADSVDMSSDGYKGDYTSVLDYYTLDDFMEYYNCTSDSSYIYISSELYYRSATNYFYLDSAFFYTNDSNITFSIDNSNGVYTLLPSSSLSFQSAWACFSFDTDTSSFNHFSFYDSFGSTYQTISGITKIEINPTSNSITAYSNSGTVNLCGRSCNISPAKYSCIDSNIDDIPIFTNGLNVDVSFTPDLSGSLDRMIEQNGVIAESDYFSMDIQNNSSTNIQFMFAVVPKGSEVNLSAASDDLSLGVDIASADGIYYFTSKEWIYSPTLAHGNVLTGKAVTQYYQSSLWHLITSKSSYSRSFKWSQLNIQKDFEYDAVVIAIPTSLDKASRIFKISSSEYYLDLSSAQEVYRSSFSVSNPLAYDATDESFGNTSNNGIIDLKNDSLRADGYINSETGETVIESVDFGENLENAHNWDPPVISKDLTDLSLEDVSSILSQSTSFFNFLATVFSWLPSWFWALILFGLTSLVVIGIVKAIL